MEAKLDAPPRCVIFEDEDLLVVNKPPGMNTHSPAPYAGQGIYDWLRDREERWSQIGIIQRLDRETSGAMVFTKTRVANKSLNDQFLSREVSKKYLLQTDRAVSDASFEVDSKLKRRGEIYANAPPESDGERAVTRFRRISESDGITVFEAEPITGKTHQIRVHAASRGIPILGDVLYGGTPSHRVHLHSHRLSMTHPRTGERTLFEAPCDFSNPALKLIRDAIIDAKQTNAYRVIHGTADGWTNWYVDKFDGSFDSQSTLPIERKQIEFLKNNFGAKADTIICRILKKNPSPDEAAQTGNVDPILIRENGVTYEIRFGEGASVGLFLDQRENRRRILTNHIGADFNLFDGAASNKTVLNTFAYTCGFSVCAALAGARTTSVDLSKKYLEWGRRNFELNKISSGEHEFIHGDVMDWLARLAKKQRLFDFIIVDPPTFSRSKNSGVFRAEHDYGKLAEAALKVLSPAGVLFASTNAEKMEPERFVEVINRAIANARRKINRQKYQPQPPDFPITRDEPGYLKTLWTQVS